MGNLQSRLKEYRLTHNLTQTQIADLLGMTYQEYQKIENGKTIIRADKLQHICETLNLSADWLLGLESETEKPKLRVPESVNQWKELDEASREILHELMRKSIKQLEEFKKHTENIG